MSNQAVSALLRRQHGVASRTQLLACGVAPHQIRRALRVGDWIPVHDGVYRHAVVPRSWEARLLAACLHLDGVASHRSAARLHGLESVRTARIELSVAHGRWRRVDGVILHQSTQMGLVEATHQAAIPCTGLGRTVLDLGAVLPARLVEDVVDETVRRRLLDWDDLYGVLASHSRKGRNGCGPLRAVLDERCGEERVPLSSWSRKVANLLVAHGLPEPRLEYRVLDDAGNLLAQVDLAYPAHHLAIELDSVRWHHNRASFEGDRSRVRRLATAGWQVLPLTWQQYLEEADVFVGQVRHLLSPSRGA